MAESLLVLVIRAYLNNTDPQGFTHALLDPYISKSLHAIHALPGYTWTIETLAREAGMSRTSFAVRFKQLTGSTPMQYCLNWRMTLAYRYLQQTTWSLPDLAERVGYQSEAAFSRAFKRFFSMTPGRIRRTAKFK